MTAARSNSDQAHALLALRAMLPKDLQGRVEISDPPDDVMNLRLRHPRLVIEACAVTGSYDIWLDHQPVAMNCSIDVAAATMQGLAER